MLSHARILVLDGWTEALVDSARSRIPRRYGSPGDSGARPSWPTIGWGIHRKRWRIVVTQQEGRLSRRDFIWRSALAGAVVGSPALLAACGDDESDSEGSAAPATTAAAATTAAPTTTAAPAPTDVRFQFDWIKNVQFAGHYVAADQGYFEAEGINAHLAQGGGGIATEVTINGPGIELGASSFLSRTIDAIEAGADLVVLGAALQQSPIGFIYLPDNPINTVEDLVGKRIGPTGGVGHRRRQHPVRRERRRARLRERAGGVRSQPGGRGARLTPTTRS